MSLDTAALPPPPPISCRTLHMAGLQVDVYGLEELAPSATRVSCLWLHHPRTRSRAYMADFAARCVGAWNNKNNNSNNFNFFDVSNEQKEGKEIDDDDDGGGGGDGDDGKKKRRGAARGSADRGLVALAYDQRNHGSRLVDEKANGSWREGNAMHAVDMFGVVQGMVADQKVLLYVFFLYFFPVFILHYLAIPCLFGRLLR